jgi:hypothetical protein
LICAAVLVAAAWPAPRAAAAAAGTAPCPLLTSPSGDAPNTGTGGGGANVDSLDIVGASTRPDASATFDAVIEVKDLTTQLPVNATELLWYFQWTTDYDTLSPRYYWAGATLSLSAPANTVSYEVGSFDPSTGAYTGVATTAGTFDTGAPGSIAIRVPAGALTDVAPGSLITQTYATSFIGIGSGGSGSVQMIDRGPKDAALYGADYTTGDGCDGVSAYGTWTPLSVAQPDARDTANLVYDAAAGDVVMFGGDQNGETWTWDGSTWTRQTPALHPPPRRAAAMAYDPRTRTVLLFGGEAITGPNTGSTVNDTWSWDGVRKTWTQLQPAVSPSTREYASLAFDAQSGQMVLFGGFGAVPTNDTWLWDPTTPTWTPAAPPVSPPPSTGPAGITYDATTQVVVMVGSFGANQTASTWTWNGTTWATSTASPAPSNRFAPSLVYDPVHKQTVLFGGESEVVGSAGYVNDTWVWQGGQWTQLQPAHSPPVRGFASSVYDPTSQRVMVFGGDGDQIPSGNVFDDQWAWDGSDWTETLWDRPAGRVESRLVYDAATRTYVLFGGVTQDQSFLNTTYVNDTWTFDGSHWRLQDPPHTPPPAVGPAMAYDPTIGRVVLLVTCISCADTTEQTWTWDGQDWTELSLPTAPPATSSAQLAYDPANGTLVLFGGQQTCNGCDISPDTWVFDGTTWTDATPAVGPTGRITGAFAYDASSQRMILFGGRENIHGTDPHFADTWAWDGATWTQLSPPISPVQREATAAAARSGAGPLVFGGFYNGGSYGDTWSWERDGWTQVTTAAAPDGRYSFALADASPLFGPLLFGGTTGDLVFLNDLWAFTPAGAPQPGVPEAAAPVLLPVGGALVIATVSLRRTRRRWFGRRETSR